MRVTFPYNFCLFKVFDREHAHAVLDLSFFSSDETCRFPVGFYVLSHDYEVLVGF